MATYYIRPWLSGQGNYPADPQEGDICITESLDQAWRPVGEGDVVKTEVYSSGEWVEQGGGGGGGGYKTATVTIIPNTYASLSIHQDDESRFAGMFDNGTTFSEALYADGVTATNTLVINGDSVSCHVYQTVDTIEGDAVWDADNSVLVISGDCTLNISGS